MADNPFDQFDRAAPSANPFDQFGGPSSTPAGASSSPPTGQSPAGPSFRQTVMNRLSAPFQGMGQATNDYVRSITNAATLGGADRLASGMPTWLGGSGNTLEQERQLTQESNKRLGWMQYPAAAVGYMSNPISDIGGALGAGGGLATKVLGGLTEGAVAGTGSAIGHGTDVGTGLVSGAAGGVVAPLIAGGIARAAGSNKPPMPNSENLHDAADSMWDVTRRAAVNQNDMNALSRNVQYGMAATGRPHSPAVPKLVNDVTDSIQPSGTPVKDLISLQDRANSLTGNDSTYGKMISNHIEDAIQAHPQAPQINAARQADVLANAFDVAKSSPPGTAGQATADYIHSHAFWLAHQMPKIPMVPHAIPFLLGLPALSTGSKGISNILGARSTEAAQRALTGTQATPNLNPSARDAMRQLLFGGTLSQ